MAIQILNDEMYELLMSVKNAQRAQPDLTMEKFTGTDGDEPSSYSEAQINAIMDFWKNPVDNYIKVSDLTGHGQKLEEMSASFRDQLTQSETRNNEAIKALSDRVEDEIRKNGESLAQSLKEHQEHQEQALKDSEERQQKQFEKLFADLDAKLSSFSSAVALHDEIKSSQKIAQLNAKNVNESAAESKPESENNSASGDKSESEVNKQPEGDEGGEGAAVAGAAPEVRSDKGVPEDEAGAESEHVSKNEGADAQGGAETASSESEEPSGGQGVHESVEASSADLAQVIAELRNLTRSVDKLSENFKTGFDELKKEVSEISCISPVPLEPKDPEKTDGSDDVINKIVKETAMSSLLASPLAILDATLRQYRDSFAQRYKAAMGCLMAQDGEVNLQFGRNAQQSLELVKNNRADYQHAVMALTQSPVATKPKAEHPQSVGVKEPAKRGRNVSHTTIKRNDVKRVDEHERSVNHSQETSPKPGAQSYAKLISDVNGSELK